MSEIDPRAFWSITYGLYIVTTCYEGKTNGQISNCVMQVTNNPPKLIICINKKELTHEYIIKSGHFGVSVLEQDAPMKLIGLFGFRSGRDIDKLSQVDFKSGPTGCPLVINNAIALLEAKVVEQMDVGSHTIFVGEVLYSEFLKEATPITYAYYHEIKKGKDPEYSPLTKRTDKAGEASTPPPPAPIAPSPPTEPSPPSQKQEKQIQSEAKKGNNMTKYICNVCGYIYDPAVGDPDGNIPAGTSFEDLPDDWVCPVCGVSKEEFSPL